MDNPMPTVDAPNKPPRRFRRTRIVLSVFFAVVTVALLVLWVRSYSRVDEFRFQIWKTLPELGFGTALGMMGVSVTPSQSMGGTRYESIPIDDFIREYSANCTTLGFGCFSQTPGHGAIVWPIWLPTAITASMAWWLMRSPFRLPQFSLRSMLIATTLVAVVLGLGVWSAR